MTGYIVATYGITNPEAYPAYVAEVGATLTGMDVEVLVADYDSEVIEGEPGKVTVVLKFASKAAAREWYNSKAYQGVVHHRTTNTVGSMVLVDQFVPPT